MKVTIGRLIEVREVLVKIIQADMPAKFAFLVGRFSKKITEVLDEAEKQRVKLVHKYGTKQDNKDIIVSPENIELFNKEFSELLATEVEIDSSPLKLEWLETVSLSPVEIIRLDTLLQE